MPSIHCNMLTSIYCLNDNDDENHDEDDMSEIDDGNDGDDRYGDEGDEDEDLWGYGEKVLFFIYEEMK